MNNKTESAADLAREEFDKADRATFTAFKHENPDEIRDALHQAERAALAWMRAKKAGSDGNTAGSM